MQVFSCINITNINYYLSTGAKDMLKFMAEFFLFQKSCPF